MHSIRIQPALLDRIEQGAIVVAWLSLVYKFAFSGSPLAPLIVASESFVVFFVLIRQPTEAISVDMRDWAVSIAATVLPMLVSPGGDPVNVYLAYILILVGNAWQIGAKLFLRRRFGVVPANRGLMLDGPYKVMRHPIYAGYLVIHVGVLLGTPTLWNLAVYVVAWALQCYRLHIEESLLSGDPDYVAYMQRVRFRLLPGVY